MSGSDRDDVNRRFSEMMAQEFPQDTPTPMDSPRARKPRPEPRPEPVTLFERMDAADDEEWERGDTRFRPPTLPPMAPWSWPTKLGAGLMLLSVTMILMIAFGLPLPGWLNTVAMAAFVVGLGTLLFRLLSANSPERHDDGAQL